MIQSKAFSIVCIAIAATAIVACHSNVQTIKFDTTREMSGGKIAIAKLNPDMPRDWSGYNYVVVEMKVSTSQRFFLGFTTDHGYDEVRLHSYVPGQWNRIAIPVRFFTEPPASNIDMASTYNKPRYTGWVNIGGNVGSMTGVDSLGVRMRAPIGNQSIEIRSISLAVEDPGDAYLGNVPAIDEFGQSNLIDYPDKAHSLEELQEAWNAEEQEEVSAEELFGYSKYGGYKVAQTQHATGFFRTECIDGRWWFVDPEGYLFLSVGVDCIYNAGGGAVRNIEQRDGMLPQLPPEKYIQHTDRASGTIANYHDWNLERRYGDGEDLFERAANVTFKRMDKWGVNTIGNWSDKRLERMNRKAFMCTLYPAGADAGLMGLGDAYEPDFREQLERSMRPTIDPNRDSPWLIGYFMGNEPVWVGQEQRVCQMILDGRDRAIKTALKDFLNHNGDTPETRKTFVREAFRRYIEEVKAMQLKLDPNHLCLGYRFGDINAVDADMMAICSKVFDVLSFNCYALAPDKQMLDRVLAQSGLPMIIGEFHFGSVDRGQGQSLWQVDSQAERGIAYRYYTENGYAHPGLIGTAYFTWYDQDVLGRFDGENYNCGCIDVTDRPYREQTEAMAATAARLYSIHSGLEAPFSEQPVRPRGHDHGPDEW